MRVLRKAVAWVVGPLLVVPGTTAAAAPPDGAPAGAEVTGERWIGDRLLEPTVRSKALGGPATVRLLTPEEDPENPFPKDVLSPTEAIMGEENRAVAARLRAHGVPVTTRFYRGPQLPALRGARVAQQRAAGAAAQPRALRVPVKASYDGAGEPSGRSSGSGSRGSSTSCSRR
ncbi:hypothetical protein ACFVSX_23540 [Streptomyces rubiginosohelvolus]|uniref:hypothetical protein n=1 Tax=Streptomyces rubiginosohelvolus TaxID=67362 RepID=UPI0036D96E35